MGKLVRDRIPEIIRKSGRTPLVRTLAEQAYRCCASLILHMVASLSLRPVRV